MREGMVERIPRIAKSRGDYEKGRLQLIHQSTRLMPLDQALTVRRDGQHGLHRDSLSGQSQSLFGRHTRWHEGRHCMMYCSWKDKEDVWWMKKLFNKKKTRRDASALCKCLISRDAKHQGRW